MASGEIEPDMAVSDNPVYSVIEGARSDLRLSLAKLVEEAAGVVDE
jgi:hypothetical protein